MYELYPGLRIIGYMTRNKSAANLIRIGTSSFSENDWVGNFYPEKTKPPDFLRFYSGCYDTVEIDATYYAVPSKKTVSGWKDKTPPDFLLCAKFPRAIVHGGDGPRPDPRVVLLPDSTYPVRDRFLDHMSLLGNKLGPLVLQFPYFSRQVFPAGSEFMARLDRFLSDLPPDFRYAVEIRNRTWLKADFADLLRRHDAALVLVDQAWMPHGDEIEKMFDPVTTDFTYIRLLGDRKEIEAITTTWDKEVLDRKERLMRWADLAARLLERRIEMLIYANNHYAGHAPTTANRLRRMIDDRVN